MSATRVICFLGGLFSASLVASNIRAIGWSSERIVVAPAFQAFGALGLLGLCVVVALQRDPRLPAWLRLLGIFAVLVGVVVLASGLEPTAFPDEVRLHPPLVMLGSMIIGWGAFIALDRDDRLGLRVRMPLWLLMAAILCTVFQLLPLLPGITAEPEPFDDRFSPFSILPTLFVAVVAARGLRDPQPFGPRLARWTLGYAMIGLAASFVDGFNQRPNWGGLDIVIYAPAIGIAALLAVGAIRIVSREGWFRRRYAAEGASG